MAKWRGRWFDFAQGLRNLRATAKRYGLPNIWLPGMTSEHVTPRKTMVTRLTSVKKRDITSDALCFCGFQRSIENIAFCINRTPKPILLTLIETTTSSRYHSLAKLPRDLRRVGDGLKRNVNSALAKQVFDTTHTQQKPITKPDCVGDNFSWETVTAIMPGRD